MTNLAKNSAFYTQINPLLWEFIEESVFSTLEDSGFCMVGQEPETYVLEILIVFVRTGGNRKKAFRDLEILEKASQIAMLPSEDLKSIAYTPALVKEWERQRVWSLLLAKCFLFSITLKTVDALNLEIQESTITQWDANLIEQSAYRYETLYKLMKKGFKYLHKPLFGTSKNKTYWDMFLEICREEIDYHFEIRTSNFQQFLVDTWISCWEELAKQAVEHEDLTSLLETQKHFHSQRLLEVLAILVKEAKRDSSLRARAVAYFTECRQLGALIVEALKARNSSGKIHKSEQWKHGERHEFHNNRPI